MPPHNRFNKFLLTPARKEQTGGIILSFRSDWHETFLRQKIKIVFRKIGVDITPPTILFTYMNKPKQGIFGHCVVTALERCSTQQCLDLADEAALSKEETYEYCSRSDPLGTWAFHVGEFTPAKKPLLATDMRLLFNFTPTPMAIRVSKDGTKRIIDLINDYQ